MVRNVVNFTLLVLLLAMPLLVGLVVNFETTSVTSIIRQIGVTILFFLIPIAFFARRVWIYFLILIPLALLSPIFISSIFFFRLFPGLEMIAVVMQSNEREAREAVGNLLWFVLPFLGLYVGLYFWLAIKLRGFAISFRIALMTSIFSLVAAFAIIYMEKGLYYKPIWKLNRYDLLKTYHYPLSLFTAAWEARSILKNNTLEKARDFSFGAKTVSPTTMRHVIVLVIGEASRSDHWQLNGYRRETSPRLAKRPGVVSYGDAVAGAHYTWLSVPQLITRATPHDMNRQFTEKSVITAFEEAGYQTAWVSNQSDKEIFWTGSIVLHARTADFASFSPTYSPNFEFEDVFDDRVLPIVDSLVHGDSSNRFIVVHLSGQHWEYSRRYPIEFDHFVPSGKNVTINPPEPSVKDAIINSYDNSIRYTDMIVDSLISIIDQPDMASFLLFVADHGEDLFDSDENHLDFHFRPSRATLQVPLLMWMSPSYQNLYPRKKEVIALNSRREVASSNVFYTVVDAGNISFLGFDSTRSLLSGSFRPAERFFYGEDKQAVSYDSLFPENHKSFLSSGLKVPPSTARRKEINSRK